MQMKRLINQGSTVDKKNTNMEQGITTGLGYIGDINLTLDVAYSYRTLEYSKMYNEKYECNRSKIFVLLELISTNEYQSTRTLPYHCYNNPK